MSDTPIPEPPRSRPEFDAIIVALDPDPIGGLEDGTAEDAHCDGDPEPPTFADIERYAAQLADAPTGGVELLEWYKTMTGGSING